MDGKQPIHHVPNREMKEERIKINPVGPLAAGEMDDCYTKRRETRYVTAYSVTIFIAASAMLLITSTNSIAVSLPNQIDQ